MDRTLTLEHCTLARAVFRWAAMRRHPTGEGAAFTWRMHNHYVRNVIRVERWLISCAGKHPFETYRHAEQVAKRPHKEGDGYVIYRCRFCRKFHLAGVRPQERLARLARQEMERQHA